MCVCLSVLVFHFLSPSLWLYFFLFLSFSGVISNSFLPSLIMPTSVSSFLCLSYYSSISFSLSHSPSSLFLPISYFPHLFCFISLSHSPSVYLIRLYHSLTLSSSSLFLPISFFSPPIFFYLFISFSISLPHNRLSTTLVMLSGVNTA